MYSNTNFANTSQCQAGILNKSIPFLSPLQYLLLLWPFCQENNFLFFLVSIFNSLLSVSHRYQQPCRSISLMTPSFLTWQLSCGFSFLHLVGMSNQSSAYLGDSSAAWTVSCLISASSLSSKRNENRTTTKLPNKSHNGLTTNTSTWSILIQLLEHMLRNDLRLSNPTENK